MDLLSVLLFVGTYLDFRFISRGAACTNKFVVFISTTLSWTTFLIICVHEILETGFN